MIAVRIHSLVPDASDRTHIFPVPLYRVALGSLPSIRLDRRTLRISYVIELLVLEPRSFTPFLLLLSK